MRLVKFLLFATTLLSTAAKADINVIASVKPVHSLVSSVMQNVGTPSLIVEGAQSPHTYALKPSQAQQLQNADVVFWIAHDLEAFLEKPIKAIATNAKSIELLDSQGLVKLPFRKRDAFDDHGHEEHDKEHHGHENHAKKNHDHGTFDPHIWLDPLNAKIMVHEIEQTLVEADPTNAEKYKANAKDIMVKLDKLVDEVTAKLDKVKGQRFIVFHDAYQYFEKRFGLSAVGSIAVSPEVLPGARQIDDLKAKVIDLGVTCVFSEPQFEPKMIETVIEGTNARTGEIDPLGSSINDGSELYFILIRNMASSFKTCLSET
jgi:zinc transport system substrate-binding protein